jgi:hypothetical protein
MVLAAFGQDTTLEDIDSALQFQPGLFTWTISAAALLAERINGVAIYSQLNYRRFAEEGEAYLAEYWAPDWYSNQKQHASPNFERERKQAVEVLQTAKFENRRLSSDEIYQILSRGDLVITSLDHGILNSTPITFGHSVLAYGVRGPDVRLHDPGPPPTKSRRVKWLTFIKALRTAAELIVISRNKTE